MTFNLLLLLYLHFYFYTKSPSYEFAWVVNTPLVWTIRYLQFSIIVEFWFIHKLLKLTSHCILHFLGSVDLSKIFSQLIVSIMIFSQLFFSILIARRIGMELPHIAHIMLILTFRLRSICTVFSDFQRFCKNNPNIWMAQDRSINNVILKLMFHVLSYLNQIF